MPEFHGIASSPFRNSNGLGSSINNLISAIEFSPESKDSALEKEEAARSMAEHFEIHSPFASIFSALSEAELEMEPMEDLESLEREEQAPDDSQAAEAEELKLSFAGPQLSIPFVEALSSEMAFLAAEDDDAPTAMEEAEGLETEQAAEAAVDLETEQAAEDAMDLEMEPAEEAEDGGVVTERNGVIYINESVLRPGREILKSLDRNFKNLIDSVLNRT
jgi:hypothetical protein